MINSDSVLLQLSCGIAFFGLINQPTEGDMFADHKSGWFLTINNEGAVPGIECLSGTGGAAEQIPVINRALPPGVSSQFSFCPYISWCQ